MTYSERPERHLKFYGLSDLATPWQAADATEILEHFDPDRISYTLTQIIEISNAKLFIDAGAFPNSYSDADQEALQELISAVQRTIGRYFSTLDDAGLANLTEPLPYDYQSDLLELFARNKVYRRTTSAAVLGLLDRLDLHLPEMLASRELVDFCNDEMRARLIAHASNAELLLQKYLEENRRRPIYLPASLTKDDASLLINQYLDGADPNPNILELIFRARPTPAIGLNAKMKLKAKRRHDQFIADFFANNAGMRNSCEVAVSSGQEEPVVTTSVGGDTKLSYSGQWLEENLDYPTVMNNFIFLFEFADSDAILTLPSYFTEISALESAMTVTARDNYRTGTVFRLKDQCSSLQLRMYLNFLRDQGIELEAVLAWFFTTQASVEFGLSGFSFTPSSSTSTYLERCRHLFSEMEGVTKQYTLFVQDGEIDSELLSITSEAVQYKGILSLLTGKYVYLTDQPAIRTIMHLLFSDQAGLGYISEELNARSAAALLAGNTLSYDTFHAHQRDGIDYLVSQRILSNTGEHLEFVNRHQIVVLKNLYDHETASYHHYPMEARSIIDEMVHAGWLIRESTLLSRAEASYFNYVLNQSEFSNGPDLRNKYLHGSQANTGAEQEHFYTYVTVLKLLVALAIKINDDLCLHAEEADDAAT